MTGLATSLEENRLKPVAAFGGTIGVTPGRRVGTIPAALAGNLKAQAIFELGFRVKVALKRAEEWVAEVRVDGQPGAQAPKPLTQAQIRRKSVEANRANRALDRVRDEAVDFIRAGQTADAIGALEELFVIAASYEEYLLSGDFAPA